ncbi:MAG: protein translocase subunit SecD, partial [Planctomycetota bacterium]
VIALVVTFFAWWAYRGTARGELELGIDLRGGSELRYKLDLRKEAPTAEGRGEIRDVSLGIIQDRIDGYGLKDIVLQPIGDDGFTVQVSARTRESVDAIKDLIEQLGNLEFRITVEPPRTGVAGGEGYAYSLPEFQRAGGENLAAARVVTPDRRRPEDKAAHRYANGLKWYPLSQQAKKNMAHRSTDSWVLCRLDRENVSGEDLTDVVHRRPQTSRIGGGWVVTFNVKSFARPRMASLTATKGEHMAIILNDHVDSAPVLQSTLSANGEISGGFSREESRKLAAVLQAGALRTEPELVEETSIAPELAGSARNRGVNSTVLGFLFVLALMFFYYRVPGLVANVALLLNLLFLVGVLAWFEAVLTLPGMAGVILTIGMAVDANILVFERIKEEKGKGRTPAQALETGYNRALVTIIDSNLTTLITAYFLFQIGSGPVRGFGVTLAVGIIASMFTALFVTRTLLTLFVRRGWMREIRMRGEFRVRGIGWMSMRRTAGLGSVVALVAALVVFFGLVPRNKNWGLEFTKGSKLVVRLHEPMELAEFGRRLATLAQRDPLFGDLEVRVTAEAIGAAVREDRALRFELRSQRVALEQDIRSLVRALREEFADKLVPGPFRQTLRPTRAGSAGYLTRGEIHFAAPGATPELVEEAFRQHSAPSGAALAGARVEAITPPAAGAAAWGGPRRRSRC